MKKRLFYYIFFALALTGALEFHLFYLIPNGWTFGGYFSSVFLSLVNNGSDKIIRINLYNKSLVLIEGGQVVLSGKISGQGNPKFSPTPQGNFKISYKADRVNSLTYNVIMPLSMRFSGHYYIHGIPFWKSGEIYNTPYSGGCVRLGPGTDRDVYDWADIGTKVQIYKTRLVKSEDSPTVFYLTPDGYREPIANPEVFNQRGFRWNEIVVIPGIELNALPEKPTAPEKATKEI